MTTLKEVAQLAQVSTATVSKVLSSTPYVSEETKARVLKAVEELNYVPNLAARALSKGRTFIIGVIFPYNYDHLFSDPHMMTLLEGVETICTTRGYNMLISTPRVPVSELEQYQRLISSGYLDGVITLETIPDRPVSDALARFGYPFIAVGYRSATGKSNILHADDFGGAKSIANYILSLGHREVGIIGVDESALSAGERRMAGYRAAFTESKLNFDNVPLAIGNFSVESGYHAAEHLLQRNPRPTAILCLNDRMAMGAIQCVRAMGLRVPEEVSIVGFDDIPNAEYFNPPLTTVRQPANEMGVRAANMLFDLIEQQKQSEAKPALYQGIGPIVFPTELIIRHSTAPVQGGNNG